MRLPDSLYVALERLYFAQRTIRREESQRRADAEDQALRAWADRMREAHHNGECGGAPAGCCFVPCVPRVT